MVLEEFFILTVGSDMRQRASTWHLAIGAQPFKVSAVVTAQGCFRIGREISCEKMAQEEMIGPCKTTYK